MVRAAALDPMDVLVASGYGSFIRKFLIKYTLRVSMEISNHTICPWKQSILYN